MLLKHIPSEQKAAPNTMLVMGNVLGGSEDYYRNGSIIPGDTQWRAY